MSTSIRICLLGSLLALAACTVEKTPAPPLTGPSELGLRLALQVTPDSILQDGASQASIQIDATGADGRPVRGLALRVEVLFDGIVQDFGTLSAKTVITGDDGRARVIYTSPSRPALAVNEDNVITVRVTPVGTDYAGEVGRTATLRLVTPGILGPPPIPNNSPIAAFTVTPANPQVLSSVVFDALATTDEGVQCGAACTYVWDFGDGGSGTGIFATHQYSRVDTYQVRLTVTDSRGASNTAGQALTVGAGAAPSASFNFSPTNPAVSQTIFFTAEASRAATGRRIVSYDWNFGSGRTGSGVTTSKSYDTPGPYNVTLTVTDDAGQQATVSQTVTVGGPNTGPQARLTVSPTTGTTATTFFFDASGSTPGPSPIVEYRFRFGDNTPDVVGASATTSHRFTSAGTYTVTVTVRDSANRTSIGTVSVSVQ